MGSQDEAIGGLAAAESAAQVLRGVAGGIAPRSLVILGSGLDGVVADMDVSAVVPFTDVPGFPAPTVEGHAGRFVFGRLGATPVLAMQGRFHLYEGHPARLLALPVRVAKLLGCDTLVVTNAAGGVSTNLAPGDVVLITDHLNLMSSNPLSGPNVDEFGPRFPVMVDAYTPALLQLASDVAAEQNVEVKKGVYAALPGPTYETPAEVRMLGVLGADVVGMSTVPEVIAAVHAGMDVLGMSLVTNMAGSTGHGHSEVLETSALRAPVMARLVAGILSRL